MKRTSYKRIILENNHPDKELFTKYLNNQCTPEEVKNLLHYINTDENESHLRTLINEQLSKTEENNMIPDWENHLSAIHKNILHHVHSTQSSVFKHKIIRIQRRKLLSMVALFIGLFLCTAVYYIIRKPHVTSLQQTTTTYTRYLLLPDGSKVVVHANSKVEYPKQFSGNTREVILIGEAYFDIHHDPSKPFIIHTGKLKTTVLGTAFNIKAYPNATNITITVTRGKVRVEDDKKTLDVLTPDKQLVYNLPASTTQKQSVIAAETVKWTKENMEFESVSFENIAAQISKRYQTTILFTNEDIKKCPVTASFSGMETLDEVISFLCLARNATYTKKHDNIITIDGKGCSE